MSRKVSVSIDNHLAVLGPENCYATKVMVWDKPSKEGACLLPTAPTHDSL